MAAQFDRIKSSLARAIAVSCVAFVFGSTIFPPSLSRAQGDDFRCVGCAPSPQGKWPWQVFLRARWNQPTGEAVIGSCGGSIIWPGWVLTAAHCVVYDKRIADAAEIVVGNVDRTKGDLIGVLRIFPHEHYDAVTAFNDVAVLQLTRNYGDGLWIPVADDGTDEKFASPGQTAAIAGWGATWDPRLVSGLLSKEEQSLATEPVILRDAEVTIVDRRQCQARYQEAAEAEGGGYRVTDDHICAGDTGKGVCLGDSGGPLMVEAPNRVGYTQIGITSWVNVCGEPGFPGVFTRLSRYRDWVANKIAGR